MSGTSSIPGWYINFQAAVIKQLPRPGEIDQEVAEGWESNQASLKKNLASFLLPPTEPPKSELLLEPVGKVSVPATTKKFRAGASFLLKRDGGICSYLGDNFKHWFLEGDGKIEEKLVGGQTLHYGKLRKSSVDKPIIAELGGEEKSEMTLFEMFSLMEKQKNGEDGVLLNNGYANIFYVRDASGVLRAVIAYWVGGGWSVGADSVEIPDAWSAGYRVFSRKPLETQVTA